MSISVWDMSYVRRCFATSKEPGYKSRAVKNSRLISAHSKSAFPLKGCFPGNGLVVDPALTLRPGPYVRCEMKAERKRHRFTTVHVF